MNRCPARQPIELALPLIGLPAVASSYAAWQKVTVFSATRLGTTGIGPTVWTRSASIRARRSPASAKNVAHPSRKDSNAGRGIRCQSTRGRSGSARSIEITV